MTETRGLARSQPAAHGSGIVISHGRPVDLATGAVVQKFVALDKYADEGAVAPTRLPRLGKISAGYKDPATGYPVVSRDGTIYLSDPDDRCTELRKALDAADLARREGHTPDGKILGSMHLGIALPFDLIDQNLQQAYVRYTAGRLEAHGDARQLTELVVTEWRPTKGGGKEAARVERHTYYPGVDFKNVEDAEGNVTEVDCEPGAFKRLKRTCQVTWNLLFTLGQWEGEGTAAWARPILADGLGVYTVTSAARKGLQDVGDYLELVSTLCRGRLRGIVLDLSLSYPPVSDPLGNRRASVPRWTLVFKPPAGIMLDPARWQELAAGSLEQGAKLSLPAPSPETWDEVEQDMRDLVEPDAAVLDQLLSGDLPASRQAQYWAREWFGRLQDSPLGDKLDRTRRAQFIRERTHGRADGLERAIQVLSNAEMQELLTAAIEWDAQQQLARSAPVERAPADRPAAADDELAELRRKAAMYDRIYSHQFGDETPREEDVDVPAPPIPAAAVGGPRIEATGSVLPPQSDTAAQLPPEPPNAAEDPSPSSVAASASSPATPPVAGELADTASPARTTQDLEASLLQALRPVADGDDEAFSCAACGRQVRSVGLDNEGDLPARAWLKRLAAQGIDQALCRDDARTAVLRKRTTTRRKEAAAS